MNFQQPEKTHHCHWKKQLWKYEMKNDLKKKIIIIQQSSPFLIPQKNWIIMKKKWIVIQFGLKYLKRTSLCTWKVHIPFLSTTLQNTAQSRAKKCLFCIQNKKSCQTIIGQNDFEKTKTFWFSSNKYTNLPLFPPI